MDEIMKGITCCADCAYYNVKKHRCTRATDGGKPTDHFYADCPLPTVPVKRGRWISIANGNCNNLCRCSECKETWLGVGGYNYCPNCGADMREEKSE